ncbi:MAG: SpoIID/LytB domain-containing protein [Agathobacter sp.]|nr:SpoIID/LytB domain-containing protein [Agathobacter sp.]
MNFDPKYKKITAIILLIVGICLVITGLILSKLMKSANGESDRYWFFEESVSTGQPIVLEDVFIVSVTEDKLSFIYDYMTYVVEGSLAEPYFGVANITIHGDNIEKISIKPDSMTDILSAYTDQTITLKNNGIYNRREALPIYQIINNQVLQVDWNHTIVGVSNLEYILDNGVISAILIKEETVPTDIRVVIKNGDNIFYDNVYIKTRSNGGVLDAAAYFSSNQEQILSVNDGLGLEMCDNSGNPIEVPFEGYLHVYKTENGFVVINEVDMETYLKYVVPSEMPTSYGHEALKAQAVCARTYAYSQMHNQSYAAYGANIDDSTAFQAYHNTGRYPESDAAVDETAGEVITCNGELITCYYYSTSPGVTNNMSAWESADTEYIACSGMEFSDGLNLQIESDFSKFINQQTECYDAGSSFYRWNAVLDIATIRDESKGALQGISVKARNEAGYITAIELQYANTTEILRNENDIRRALGVYQTEIQLNNGQTRTDISMVPSACFEVAEVSDGKIVLRGGGFGHGIGMSQYGAKSMAELGYDYKDIINYYYENVEVENSTI